ncbi:hypothetical protein HDU86_007975 [Geranomyces michiganensis]|nr:hypothetical protein HDU86_007975 [Geranomyces michiganensis]
MGTKGMVSSSQPLATAAGIQILELGGNAADAAIAVAAALNVTEPCSTGIGGDAFCLYWDATARTVKGLNGSGRSPAKMTLDALKGKGLTAIPLTSVHSVTVPGAAASWVDTRDRFGSGKLSLAQILAPAIRLAEDGYPVHELVADAWQRSEGKLQHASPNGSEMLMPSGTAPRAGDIMRMPNLANTFRCLAEHGKDGFYRSRIADAIVEVCKAQGGLMELDDLDYHANVGSEPIDPISYEYGASSDQAGDGVTLHECPPNGQGLVALMALGILDALQRSGAVPDLSRLEHNSAEYLHALIEALRFAFADAHQYVADQQHDSGPDRVAGLLSRAYLDERAKLFDASRTVEIEHGNPPYSSDTVYLTCTDAEGNACSFIQSNYAGFGSCIVPKNCGFTLANRCATFRFQPGFPNSVGPRKRPYNTIIPAMATRQDKDGRPQLFVSYGVMGGFMQPQGHVQVLLNLLRGFTPQAAIDAPRFCIGAGTPDQGALDSTVHIEQGIAEEVIKKLEIKGHRARPARSWAERAVFGRGQIIARILTDQEHPSGTGWAWAAGSDPRADGCAFAQI